MSHEKILIKLKNVWKVYQLGEVELSVLQDINLEIRQGSFTTIMGPSGSGKSTLLHLISCLDTPTKGQVLLKAQDVSDLSSNELAQIRNLEFGFVFQQFNLLPNLTALENVMLPMVMAGIPENQRLPRAQKILSSVNLEHRTTHHPNQLSGGEQQRVAIARALSNNPSTIVADEPTGNIDSTAGEIIMNILSDLHEQEGKTVIMVTHDQDIARRSKEIIHIRDGKIVDDKS